METKKNILIVEDNGLFESAAQRYAVGTLGLDKGVLYRKSDYENAIDFLNENPDRFSGAIIDCFFPRLYGSNDRELGKKAIEIMRAAVPSRRNSPVTRALSQVGDLLGENFAKFAAKNANVDYNQYVDHFRALESALEGPESNQALGILVADAIEKKGIPFVLATSTNHHDVFTQPIADYCGFRGWKLIDCAKGREEDKESTAYWARVFDALGVRK